MYTISLSPSYELIAHEIVWGFVDKLRYLWKSVKLTIGR